MAMRGGAVLPVLRRRVEEVPGRVALDVLHHEVVAGVGRADLEDGDDVRVVDAGREARLVEEHLDELGVPRQVLVQPLDGVRAAGIRRRHARRARNTVAHPPARELRDQLEPIELRSNHLRHDGGAPKLGGGRRIRALFCTPRRPLAGAVPPGLICDHLEPPGPSLYGAVA